MAFDGLSWYRLNRPVSEEERAARLVIDQPASDTPKDDRSVFSMSDTFLEVRNGTYSEKGWGVVAFMLPGLGSLAFTAVLLWMLTHVPPIYEQRGQLGLVYGAFGFFLFIALCFSGIGIWALTRDCFNYTCQPIRFDRRNRMIYAFKHNGPGGVVSVPWDTAFLYMERKPRRGPTRTAPRMVRCLVFDDKGLVKDTFSVGTRVVLAFDESSVGGQEVMNVLYQDFEYYRRFMEEGPASVPPVTEFLPKGASLRNALRLNFEGWSALISSRNPMVWLVMGIGALPAFIFSLMQWFAQLTCREPVVARKYRTCVQRRGADQGACCMSRRFIREGDKTDRNGVVADGIAGTSFQGQPFAYLGASIQCPACGTTGVIISDGSPRTITLMGKQVALENDLCQCKCEPLPKLVATQNLGSIKM